MESQYDVALTYYSTILQYNTIIFQIPSYGCKTMNAGLSINLSYNIREVSLPIVYSQLYFKRETYHTCLTGKIQGGKVIR